MMHQRPLSLQLTLTIMRAVKRNGKLNVLYKLPKDYQIQKVTTEKWTNYTWRDKSQIKQGRQHFLPLVDMYSKIK